MLVLFNGIYKQLENLEILMLGIMLFLDYDTTQATASDRLKMYVNGEQQTEF